MKGCLPEAYLKGPYIYDVHTEGGWGSLEICHAFANSCSFFQMVGEGVKKLVIFCGCHKQMTPKDKGGKQHCLPICWV